MTNLKQSCLEFFERIEVDQIGERNNARDAV